MKNKEKEVLIDKDGNEVILNNKKKSGCLKWILIAIGVIIFFTACNAIVFNDDAKENSKDDSTSNSSTESASEQTIGKEEVTEEVEEEEMLNVGEATTLEDIEVTIHDAQLTDFRREYADKDYKNVLWIDATVRNNSDKDIVVQTLFEGYVNNKEVELYRTGDNDITSSGPLRAGREIEGSFAFAFDEDADKFELVFSPFLSDDESVYEIDLK